MRRADGQAHVEWLAAMLLVAAIAGAVVAGGGLDRVATAIGDKLTCLVGGEGCSGGEPSLAQAAAQVPVPGGGLPVPPGPPVPVPPGQTTGPGAGPHATDPSGSQADPVNSLTGAFEAEALDAALPAPGVPMAFVRSYTSGDEGAGGLGPGWTHSYAGRLEVSGATAVLVGPTGQRSAFRREGGAWRGAPGVQARLVERDGAFEVERPDGVREAYDGRGRLGLVADRRGQGVRAEYEGDRLVALVDAAGARTALDWEDGRLRRLRLPDGRSVAFEHDDRGRLVAVRDLRGGVTRYEVDDAGRITEVRQADGRVLVRNRYGEDGRVVAQVDGQGRTTRFVWDRATQTSTMVDPRGGRWSDVYRNGALVARIDPLGHRTLREYGEGLRLEAITDAAGRTSRLDHDDRGRIVAVTGPDGATARFERDERGEVVATVDETGRRTELRRDEHGDVVAVTGPDGATTRIDRDDRGLPTAVTDPEGGRTRLRHDERGQLAEVVDPEGGRTRVRYDASGSASEVVDARGSRTTIDNDAAGLLVARRDAVGGTVRVERDALGRPVAWRDARGALTRVGYDPMGRLERVVADDGATTRYRFDAAGNLTEVVAPSGAAERRAYDLAGRLIALEERTGGRVRLDYDPTGALTRIENARGLASRLAGDGRTTIARDLYGRPERLDFSGDTPDVALGWDAAGRLQAVRDQLGELRLRYDEAGRLAGTARGAERFRFDYDRAGRLVAREAPSGSATRYGLDRAGRITEVRRGDDLARIVRDEGGIATELRLPGGVVERREHDAAGRVTAMRATGPGGEVLRRRELERDASGRPTAIRTEDGEQRLAYDRRGRLVRAGDVTYAFDGAGNLVQAGDVRFEHDRAGRLLRAGATTFEHDADGNLVRAGDRRMAYDDAGRLQQVRGGGADLSYEYDGLGRRVRAGDVRLAWDSSFALPQVAEERDGGGRLIRDYTYGGERLWLRDARTGRRASVLRDQVGSAEALADGATGRRLARYRTTPFGQVTVEGEDLGNPMTAFGERRDEAGLVDLRARTYDPALGRFLQLDPAAGPGVLPFETPYAYGAGAPTQVTDPSGAFPPLVIAAVAGAVIGGGGGAVVHEVTEAEGSVWSYVGAGAVGGAASPLIAAAAGPVLGVGAVGASAIGGAGGGIAGTAALDHVFGGPSAGIDDYVFSGVLGGVASPIGRVLGPRIFGPDLALHGPRWLPGVLGVPRPVPGQVFNLDSAFAALSRPFNGLISTPITVTGRIVRDALAGTPPAAVPGK